MNTKKINLVVLLDGTYGVGKTTISLKVNEILTGKFKLIDSDNEYRSMIKKNPLLALGGALPQNNMNFITQLRKTIIENAKDNNLIVTMSLSQPECLEYLYRPLASLEDIKVLHVILLANKEAIKKHINYDKNRDKTFALEWFESNEKFFEENYLDAIKINIENKSINELAETVSNIILNYNGNL